MRHIKHVLLAVMAVAASVSVAQNVAEYILTVPGTLSSFIPDSERSTVNKIKISGLVDARDFYFIRDSLSVITSVDMTDAAIEKCEIDGRIYGADEIPDEAFGYPLKGAGKARLSTFYFPLNTRAIGDNAFYMCSVFREHNIAELSLLRSIGSAAFSRCNRLREFYLPASVETIGAAAFAYDVLLTSFDVPENSLLQTIGEFAFNGCSQLKSLDFISAGRLYAIGSYAFASCSQLTAVQLPASVNDLGEGVFMYSSAISAVDWSELTGLLSVEGSMFYGATSLVQVKLPASVQTIKSSVFTGCTSLKTVSLPYNLSAIGDWAFSGCTALDSLFCPAQSVPLIGYETFENVSKSDVTVAVDATKLSLYREETDWSDFRLVGLDISGVGETHSDAFRICRQGNILRILSNQPVSHIVLYDYSGRVVRESKPQDCDVSFALPNSHTRYIIRIVYADGSVDVVK